MLNVVVCVVVDLGVAHRVGAFVPVLVPGPGVTVFGGADGLGRRLVAAAGDVVIEGFAAFVVDEEVAAVVAGEEDVLLGGDQDDVGDLGLFGVVVDVDAHHDRGFIADPAARHGVSRSRQRIRPGRAGRGRA
jgi:hypothetical protein